MRKIFITESQFQNLMKEIDGYLDKNDMGTDVPQDSMGFNGNEITGKDPESNTVPVGDKIAHSRVSGNPLARRSFMAEDNVDNQRAYVGKKAQDMLPNLNGKMAQNIARELNNGGSKNNTTKKRMDRLEQEKKKNPQVFAQNGGDEMIKSLKSLYNMQRNSARTLNKAMKPQMVDFKQPSQATGKGHHKENPVYYDTEE